MARIQTYGPFFQFRIPQKKKFVVDVAPLYALLQVNASGATLSSAGNNMKDPIDYLILAPLNDEVKALREIFGASHTDKCYYRDKTGYWPVRLECSNGMPVIVHIAQLKHQGVLDAAVTTARLLEETRPTCVVSFGIAGGFIKKVEPDVQLGDVVVADQPIVYYEPAKEGRAGRSSRMFSLPIDVQLMEELVKICGGQLHGHKLRRGPIASGEKLINDLDSPTREAIRALHEKTLAVDMEAAGVAAAAREAQAAGSLCRVLVLKGVSDDAVNKGSGRSRPYRKRASKHAAAVLHRFISNNEWNHAQPIDPIPVADIRIRAEMLCKALAPWVWKEIDSVSAARVLYPLDEPPLLFYRWDLLHAQMHWVDFHFLLVIRNLIALDLKLPVHLLVSDMDTISDNSHANTERIVNAVLGPTARVHWYTKTLDMRGHYGEYAQAAGFDQTALHDLFNGYDAERQKFHIPGDQAYNSDTFDKASHWLQYIGWLGRYNKRCIYLHWQRHAATMERFLLHFLELSPLVVYTPDITLDGTLGKFSPPGNDLVIDPPRFESILGWLEKATWDNKVVDLAQQLAVHKRDTRVSRQVVGALLAGRPALKARLTGNEREVSAANQLVNTLAHWNQLFFNGW